MFNDMRGVMVRYPYVAGPDMLLSEAEIYMKECEIRHLPLVQNNKVVGLVSERDILFYKKDSQFAQLTLGEIVDHPPFVVSQLEPLSKVLGIMAKKKYGSALMVDDDSHLVGIFTVIDALLLLENMISGDPNRYRKDGEVIQLRDVAGWN